MKLQRGYFLGHLIFLNVERSSGSAPITKKSRSKKDDGASSTAIITSPPLPLPLEHCGDFCEVAGDIQTVIIAPKPPVDNPTRFALEPSEIQSSTYLVVQVYTIRSEYLSKGNCISTENTASLSSAFSILRASDAITKAFQRTAELDFIDFLGFSTCSGGGELLLPTELVQVSNVSYSSAPPSSALSSPVSSEPKTFDNITRGRSIYSSAPPSSALSSPVSSEPKPFNNVTRGRSIYTAATTLPSSVSNQLVSSLQPSTIVVTGASAVTTASNESLNTGPKVGIGVGVPLLALFLLLFGYFLWQRQQFLKQKLNQQPEELENNGVAQEVEAETRRLEVEGDGGIHEMASFERQQKLEPRQPSHAVVESSQNIG